jgi:hypothetical protein
LSDQEKILDNDDNTVLTKTLQAFGSFGLVFLLPTTTTTTTRIDPRIILEILIIIDGM